LKPNQTTLGFMTSAGCATPARATVRITNDGPDPSGALTVSVTAPFVLGVTDCQGRVLGPAASCDAEVTFVTSSVGPANGRLTAAASPGGTILVDLSATAFLREAPNFDPGTHDFGPIPVGRASPSRKFMLHNTGSSPAPPLTTSVSGADFAVLSDTCNHAVLQPGQSCAVEVVFQPVGIGFKNGTVAVEVTDACGRSTATASLTGNGVSPPDGGTAPPALDGSAGGDGL
jgi:hypothetical protein